jgi:hypothetical protein
VLNIEPLCVDPKPRRREARLDRVPNLAPPPPDPDKFASWKESAACATSPTPDLWFDDLEAARVVCKGCPVQADCLAEATALEEAGVLLWGVWGGLSPAQRSHQRQGWRRTPRRS